MVCTPASRKAGDVLGLDKGADLPRLPRQPPSARFERLQDLAGEPIEIARLQSKLGVDNRYKPGENSAYETSPDALGSKEVSGVGFVDYLTNAHYPSVLPKPRSLFPIYTLFRSIPIRKGEKRPAERTVPRLSCIAPSRNRGYDLSRAQTTVDTGC